MDILLIVVIVVAVLAILFLVGGYVATRKRPDNWAEHVAEAETALEKAWAEDKGWDREVLHRSAREALGSHKPGWEYSDVHIVGVDDQPGVAEDKARLVAIGEDGEAKVVLARDADGGWTVESVS